MIYQKEPINIKEYSNLYLIINLNIEQKNSLNTNKYNIKQDELDKNVYQFILEHINSSSSLLSLSLNEKEFSDKFFIISRTNGKLINKFMKISNLFDKNSTDGLIYLNVYPRLKGGSIIDAFMSIIQIGKFFVMIGDLVVWIFKMIGWIIIFVIWLLTDFLNPINLLTDFFNSVMIILIAIFRIPLDLISGIGGVVITGIGSWFSTFWGWDQSNLTKNDMQSNYFRSFQRTKGKKCYLTNSNTVPFSVLLGTIVCPPMGVFMDMGLTGWLNILICVLLTLAFYIPGLVYALLIIYS
jgi:uncharacterized membrane protein YqaE (UPF0057 family)